MVYGTQRTFSIPGAQKPTYNVWGPHIVWVQTYEIPVFGGINIHEPAILGYPLGTRVLTYCHMARLMINENHTHPCRCPCFAISGRDVAILINCIVVATRPFMF